MAGTVETNIKVNVDVKSNAQQAFDELIKDWNKVESTMNSMNSTDIPDNLIKYINHTGEEVENTTTKVLDLRQRLIELGKGDMVEDLYKQFNAGDFDFSKFEEAANALSETSESAESLGENTEGLNINFENIAGSLMNIAKSGNISASSLNGLAKTFGMSAGEAGALGASVALLVASMKAYKKCYDETLGMLRNVGTSVFDGIGNSIGFIQDAMSSLIDILDTAINKLEELTDVGVEIQDSFFSLYSYLGKETGDTLFEFANQLESIYDLDATGVIADMNNIVKIAGELGATSDDIAKASEEMYTFAQNARVMANTDMSSMTRDLQLLVQGTINNRNSLFRSRILNENDLKALKSLNTAAERWNYIRQRGVDIEGTYEKYLDTEAGKIEKIKQQFSSFVGNLGQLVLGLVAQLAPAITFILEMANKAVTGLMSILNINVTSRTGEGFTGALNNISEGFNEVEKSAEKANKKVAKFDDVIQINNSDSKDNSIAAQFNDIDLGTLIGDIDKAKSKLEEFKEAFVDLIDNKRYKDAAKLLSTEVTGWLENIPWSDIKSKFADGGKAIGEFINGLTDDTRLGKDIGESIANIINTIVTGIKSLGKELDFRDVGKTIGAIWDGFWGTLSTSDMAETAMSWFIGLFQTIGGFLSSHPFENAGLTLSNLLNQIFLGGEDGEGLSPERISTIVSAVVGFINEVMNGIGTFLANADIDDIKDRVKELIINLVSSIKDNAGNWGSTLNDLITTVIDTLSELLSTADSAGLQYALMDFFNKLDLAEIMSKWIHLKVQVWWTQFKIKAGMFLQTLGQFIGDAVIRLVQIIGSLLAIAVSAVIILVRDIIWKFVSQLFTDLGDNWNKFINAVSLWFTSLGILFETKLNDVKSTITNKLSGIKDSIFGFFNELWNKIVGWVDNIKEKLSGIWDGLTSIPSGISGLFSGTGNSGGWKLPWMATGGIVDHATLAVVGEAGREAIMPLESNTGWMDYLASKLNNKMGNNVGGSVVIDMSKCTKPYYSRSEMIEFGGLVAEGLKQYGANVTIAY